MLLKLGAKENFYIQAIALRRIGIEVSDGKEAIPIRFKWYFWILFLIDLLRVCCSSAGSLTHSSDLDVTTAILATLVQDCLTLWKATMFIMVGNKAIDLVNKIQFKASEATNEELRIVFKELRKDRVLTGTYFTACNLTAVSCIVAPVVTSIVLTLKNDEPTFILPFEGKYIIDSKQPYNYIVVVTFSAISLYFAINSCAAVDAIYSWFVHSIAAHFQRLELKLQRVGSGNESLSACIQFHQWIIKVTQDFATLFRPIIFVEFSLNSLQLCLIAFRIVLGFSLHSTPFLIIFLGAVFIQLIIYSYAGQKLQNESERIAFAIYDNMQSYNYKNRSLLLIPMIRAQNPCKLDGIFFIVNFELFIWVMRTSGSFLTMLKSLR